MTSPTTQPSHYQDRIYIDTASEEGRRAWMEALPCERYYDEEKERLYVLKMTPERSQDFMMRKLRENKEELGWVKE